MKTLFCNMSMSVGTVAQQSATVLMFSSSEWAGTLMLFSFTPPLFIPFLPSPTQRVDPARHRHRNITSLSSQPQVNSD